MAETFFPDGISQNRLTGFLIVLLEGGGGGCMDVSSCYRHTVRKNWWNFNTNEYLFMRWSESQTYIVGVSTIYDFQGTPSTNIHWMQPMLILRWATMLVYSGRQGGPIHFGLRMYFFWGWLHVIWLILQMQKKYKLSVHFFNDIVFFYLQLGKQKLKICNNMENKIKTLLENGSL